MMSVQWFQNFFLKRIDAKPLNGFLSQLMIKSRFKIAFLLGCGLLSLSALIFPIALRPSIFQLSVGDVSQQDILAPNSIQYESSYLTEQARKEAEKNIGPVYLQADPSVARKRLERLKITLAFISVVRADVFSSTEQKRSDLETVQDLTVNDILADELLNQNDSRWETVQQESLRVLEQIMRSTIREDRLEDAKRQIPTLISFALQEDQASLVTDIVTPFVTANSLFSQEQTDAAREAVRQATQPITRSFVAGEIIVRRGQIITENTWEALQQFGLIRPQNQMRDFAAALAIVSMLTTFSGLYFRRRHIQLLSNPRNLLLITSLFFIFLFSGKLIISNRTVIPYVFPLAAFGLTISSLYKLELGLVFSLILSILIGYGMNNGLELTIYSIFTSMCGLLVLDKGRRVSSFFLAGLVIALSGSAVILAYRLPEAITDWIGIATLCGAAFVNGLVSAMITLVFHFIFSQFFGITTALQLLELSRPDHPLLQYMLQNAPGSYQHSLQVANMAEQAAEKIGADALLVRVGAIYHDAGKAANPLFFVENQVPGKIDSHDDIPPDVSASTIIKHVCDGVKLGKKYRLPQRIIDFMKEHHGTLLTRYQYTRALQMAENGQETDKALFQYPGPRPQSKETAILMLADGCEARARAELPKGEEELVLVVKKVFDYIQKEGQLDDTSLTLKDINQIFNSFVNTLRNSYHPRIQYPEMKQVKPASDDQSNEMTSQERV